MMSRCRYSLRKFPKLIVFQGSRMRVHPSQLRSAKVSWQLPGVLLLFAVLILSQAFTAQNDSPATVEVWVAAQDIEADEVIVSSKLTREKRSPAVLPPGVVSDLETVIGKTAVLPIPVGFPLTENLVREKIHPEEAPQKIEETVSVAISYEIPPPPPGTRVAVVLQPPESDPILLAEEAWVGSREANIVWVRAQPRTALLLQQAQGLGRISYLELGKTNPFAGEAVKDISALRQHLVKPPLAVIDQPEPKASYAWVRGDKVVYTVAPTGSIYVLDPSGEIRPLFEYRLRLPEGFLDGTQRSYLDWGQ